MTFKDCVNKSVTTRDITSHECDISLNVNGETWQAYEVSIATRDIMFSCDKGQVVYLVDTLCSGENVGVLHDFECNEC